MLAHYLFKDLLRRRKKEKEKKKVTLIVARPAAKNNLRQKFFSCWFCFYPLPLI